MASPRVPAPLSRLSAATRFAVVLGLVLSFLACWGVAQLTRDQERDLLEARATEVGLILTQASNAVPDRLRAQGSLLAATGDDPAAYERLAALDAAANQGRASYAWLRAQPDGTFSVLAAHGPGLRRGEVVSAERAAPMARALRTPRLVPGSVAGAQRALGFALGPPAAPAGTVLYQESLLGAAVRPPRQAGSAPFSDLDVVLYGAPEPDPAQVLVGTTSDLPLTGQVARRTLSVGSATWLVVVRADEPLTGRPASLAPWFLLVVGLVLTGAVAAVLETADRRRTEALQSYRTERESTELFQRHLLPVLPDVPGLDVAARYLPSQRGQQVGGDWFDVFPLTQGGVGIVIGDVMGHDVVAASGMAQVRSALRAYARREPDPALVLDLLDDLVTGLEISELVTVLYATLTEPDASGSRVLRWSSAGHLPPLLRSERGRCDVLDEASSLMIGTPLTVTRCSASRTLPAGWSLVLFTDGLVEVPGTALDEAVGRLADGLGGDTGTSADDLCDRALATLVPSSRRDDIALLVVTDRPRAAPGPLVPVARSADAEPVAPA